MLFTEICIKPSFRGTQCRICQLLLVKTRLLFPSSTRETERDDVERAIEGIKTGSSGRGNKSEK